MSRDISLTRRAALVLGATSAAWGTLRSALAQVPGAHAEAAASGPKELRIGFQKGSVNLVLLKLGGSLERRLPSVRISWIEFPAGPQLLEALAVGGIDIGATGDTPPVFAQAAGKALLYVGAEPPKPEASAILVKPDVAIRVLADLKGRRIALQKGSSAHYLLVRAVEQAGLQWTDIQPIYLPPADARAAFERGAVDAWVIWDPYYAAAEVGGNMRVLATSRGLTNNNSVYLATPALASHAATLRTVFEALTQADAWAQSHREQAARLLSDFSALSLPTVHRFLERRPLSPVGSITSQAIADQQRVADAFFTLRLIPRPIRVADAVWQPGDARLAQLAR